MENDFCRYTLRRFVSLLKYIESVLCSLESHCLLITERLNTLHNRVFISQTSIISLDYKEEFRKFENYSIRDFMLLDDTPILKNSYFITLKDCEKVLVLIKENFPKFFNNPKSVLDNRKIFSERAIDVNMESYQSKSYEQLFHLQRKDDVRIKSKKATSSKNKKITSFRSSIEKLLHIKSKSEKCLKNEDLRLGVIPQTIYLSPQQTVSLSRDTWYISKEPQINPSSKQSIRHSCSDFVCRRSSTFCMPESFVTNQIRAVSPPTNSFYPVTEEQCLPSKIVSHSTSMPAHLSKSHQSILKSKLTEIDCKKPAKRTARKKGIFNCSLFRKRSNSHSKSAEKVSDLKQLNCREQCKSLNRSEHNLSSIISDRCLTLPNLKSSEVDLTENLRKHQLLSMDLIKDYLNRSDNSLHSSINRNSVEVKTGNPGHQFSTSVHSSPHSCDTMKFTTAKTGLCDSMIHQNPHLTESFYAQQSACNDSSHARCQRATSPLTINNCAFDNSSCKKSSVTPTLNENPRSACIRQISAPTNHHTAPSPNPYLSSAAPPLPPPNSAFEFWTRPYHEKMKASRRRLLDDKVGSKEALLRSLSPHNVKANDATALYDNPYQLHIIPEPGAPDDYTGYPGPSHSPISHSRSFYGGVQYRATNQDYRPHSSASPVIENRLLESPRLISKLQQPVHSKCGNEYFIARTDVKDNCASCGNNNSICNIADGKNLRPGKETVCSGTDKIYTLHRKDYDDSMLEIKDTKSVNSSTELVLTRTPTPPHSFAESSASSIYPAPNEFITNEQTKPPPNSRKLCGTVNLLYTSDNSEDGADDFEKMDVEPVPPIPPPRTDSVVRSMQAQQSADTDKSEQEYDISDEFPPVFSGANIDRCDIEQYHKWLEKLPYKISEFPNLIQCRKSSVVASKTVPEKIDCLTKQIDFLVLKQMKQSRKSIKSWANTENSKSTDVPFSTECSDSFSLKKSVSYDYCLNSSEMEPISEVPPPTNVNPQFPIIDNTLLKQYSHLYSLKPAPTDTSNIGELNSAIFLKFNRSKSIDLRTFVNNISGPRLDKNSSENLFSQKRKSVPNSKFITTNENSGKSNMDLIPGEGSEFKLYPML